MAGDHEPRVPGSPEEDTLGGQRVTREDTEVPARWPRSFPVSRGPWPLLLLLFLSLAICFLLLVTTLVQVSRIPKSPAAEAQDRQESPSLGSASQEQVQSGLEQIRQQLGQINASLARLCRPCPWNWEPFQGSCYLFSRTLGVWEASVSSCRDLGAHLVIINSLAEQRFLRYWDVRKDQRTWIGLSDHFREGSWQWVDGAPLQLSFWQDGEPNNDGDEDCVELFQDTWNDNVCTAQNFWICEQPVVPCTGL
ncbi:CD209 antigen-like protein C isoform X1 [Fukomys damarensis]|uniref:CD209 antigen-like protein C isoform X1 n=1 Tax=Fukomys damarensis TaxID=885580 RepID=UPI0014559F64|nr:CD209 antigen-like protein C isoform X1 [Fukomys damarensis]